MRFFLAGVHVWAEERSQVVFGDSLPEGAVTTVDASRRFPHLLTARLVGTPHWVVNAGIGGHRPLGDEVGERGLARFDRDVLAVPGVGHVVAHFGLNDLGLPGVFGFDTVTAEQLIDGLTELGRPRPIRRHRVHAATVVPFGGSATLDSPAALRTRAEVNEWIRHGRHSIPSGLRRRAGRHHHPAPASNQRRHRRRRAPQRHRCPSPGPAPRCGQLR